jgi:hypothetical protein
MSLTTVCAVSGIESAKVSTASKNDPQIRPMFIVDTSYNAAVPHRIGNDWRKIPITLIDWYQASVSRPMP